jgi:hypothetical protein
VPDGAKEVLPGERCPQCQGNRTHRSRVRGPAEQFLRSFTPLRPFSCSTCNWRGWRIPEASVGPDVPLPPLTDGRRFHRSSGRSKKQQATIRIIRQILVTAVVAWIAAMVFTRCQNDASAQEIAALPK